MTDQSHVPTPQARPLTNPRKTLANRKAHAEHQQTTHSIRLTRRRRVTKAQHDLQQLHAQAAAAGLRIQEEHSRSWRQFADLERDHATRGLQLRFFRGRWCVADYWPATRTLLIGNIRRTVETVDDALRLVVELSA